MCVCVREIVLCETVEDDSFLLFLEVIDELEFNEQPFSACMRLFYLGNGMAL